MGKTSAINWTQEMLQFIQDNFGSMDARPMAQALGVKTQTLRTKYYSMGLKRIEMEYWTDEQVTYLKDTYQLIGDKEMSRIYQERWPKTKQWTIKHIEKKRNYLGLHRSKQELQTIQQRNVDNGCFLLCPVKRWEKTGVAQEGEIRYCRTHSGRMVPRIKMNGKWVFWARYIWEKLHGPIPKQHNVIFKDRDPYNLNIENLMMVSDADLSARNCQQSSTGLSDNYVAGIMTRQNPELRAALKHHPELIELKRTQLKLEREINHARK